MLDPQGNIQKRKTTPCQNVFFFQPGLAYYKSVCVGGTVLIIPKNSYIVKHVHVGYSGFCRGVDSKT